MGSWFSIVTYFRGCVNVYGAIYRMEFEKRVNASDELYPYICDMDSEIDNDISYFISYVFASTIFARIYDQHLHLLPGSG